MYSKQEYVADYRILNTKPGISWQALRKAYQRQAQLWHPDRHLQDPHKHQLAEERIKKINNAFQRLSTYKLKFGHLPQEIQDDAFSRSSTSKRRRKKSPPRPPFSSSVKPEAPTQPIKTVRPQRHRVRFAAAAILIIVSALLVDRILLESDLSNPTEDYTDQLQYHYSPPIPDNIYSKSKANVDLQPTPNPVKKYFTYGSTMGEVHEFQGTPSYTVGNTWFYGRSKIEFEYGIVKDWHTDPANPLNTELTPYVKNSRTLHSRKTSRFTLGSTMEDVRTVQGKPFRETDEVWTYGVSKVYFRDGKVVDWYNSSLDPLKADN